MIDASIGSVLLAAAALAIGLRLARAWPSDTAFVASVFVVGFGLRTACALLVHVAQLQAKGNGSLFQDDYTNDLVASWLLRIEAGEPISVFLGHEHLLEDVYVYLLTMLYWVTGHDPFAAKLLSAFFGALLVLVTYDLALHVANRVTARVAAVLMAGFPSLVLWTSLALKESLVLLLSVLVLRALVLVSNGKRPLKGWSLAWLGLPAVLLGSLRSPILVYFASLLPLVAIARVSTWSGSLRLRVAAISAVLLLLITGSSALVFSPLGRTYLGTTQLASLPESVQHRRMLMGEHGRTTLLPDVERDRRTVTQQRAGFRDLASYVATGTLTVLAAPFPWTASSGSERALAAEMLLWYGLVVVAVLGGVRLWRNQRVELLVLVASLAPALLTMALFDTNLGTMVRHRTALYPVVFILASVGIVGLLARGGEASDQLHSRDSVLVVGRSARSATRPSTNA